MAKISKFICEYTDKILDTGITLGNESLPPKRVITRFLRIFSGLTDTRLEGMVEYPIEEIVLITFLAIMSGATTWQDVALFGESRKRWLRKFMRLRNGIPSHDTFRRVFSIISTAELQEYTVKVLTENLHAIKKSLGIGDDKSYRRICVDGKEQRGTGRKYDSPDKIRNLQTLHVYDASYGICLYSEPIPDKSNEIPAAKDILSKMDLDGCIVSFDALHMQKETVRTIVNQKGDYVGGLKGNQQGLMEEAATYFNEQDLLDHYKSKGQYYTVTEKAHNQIEKREYYVCKAMKRKITKEWQKLNYFICYKKTVTSLDNDGSKVETRYYGASIGDVELCAEAIRGHWSVENNLHWQLDYTFREDDNATTDKAAFNNFSLLNKMVLTMIKYAKPFFSKLSVKSIIKAMAWNYEETASTIFSCFDEKTISEIFVNAGGRKN